VRDKATGQGVELSIRSTSTQPREESSVVEESGSHDAVRSTSIVRQNDDPTGCREDRSPSTGQLAHSAARKSKRRTSTERGTLKRRRWQPVRELSLKGQRERTPNLSQMAPNVGLFTVSMCPLWVACKN